MTHFLHILGYIALGIVGLAFAGVAAIIIGFGVAQSKGENPFQ